MRPQSRYSRSSCRLHTKALRARAQEIVQAEQRFSPPFRAEVEDALENWPHKLPALIAEAERMESRPGARRRKKPLTRSRQHTIENLAEKAESLFDQRWSEMLDGRMTERANLLAIILNDISEEAKVSVTHPRLVREYMLAVDRSGHSNKPFVAAALRHAQQILDGCGAETWQHIRDFWSDDPTVSQAARERDRSFQWHCRYFSGARELPRDKRGTSGAARINLGELRALRDRLQSDLARLEHLPEYESSRYHLETELDVIGREIAAAEEWPDVIGVDSKGGEA